MSKLPTIQDLTKNTEIAFKNDQLNAILNVETPKKWVKNHPLATKKVNGQKVPIEYVPIEVVEYLMTRIFQKWNVEVIETKPLFNSVAVTVRVHYQDPITEEMRYQDGVGAVAVQTDKGESAANLNAIKSDAVMKALPGAKSYAIKDACEHIGKIFGRDLNRPDSVAFEMTRTNPVEDLETLTELFELKCESLSREDKVNIKRIIDEKDTKSYKKAIEILKTL
ncbi:MAG TPA: hypothetical protein VGF79_01025 [Bacteroidia bacterium]